MKIRANKIKKLAPILRNEEDNLSSITTVSFNQLKLIMMTTSNNSSLELDARVSQQFLPRDYEKCTLPLQLQATKEHIFFLFCLLHHMKRSQRETEPGIP